MQKKTRARVRLAVVFNIILLLGECALGQAKSLLNLDKTGVAVQGFDVVAYFAEGKPVKGSPRFVSVHEGALYQFASLEHQQAFEKEPGKYAPQFGGYCAFGVSKGALVKIEPKAFQILNGRLLLQYDKGVREKFSKDPERNLAKADTNWPGLIDKKGK